jgi:hypothetical protein
VPSVDGWVLLSRLATWGWGHIGSMGDRLIYALGVLVLAFTSPFASSCGPRDAMLRNEQGTWCGVL